MKITPLYDRVLIVPYSENKSNIMLPDDNQSEKMRVIALGKSTSGDIKLNDIVLINKYAGAEFYLNDQKYILIKEIDILGIIGEENE